MMEYSYYAEQKYMYAGYIEARILTAQEAAALGYEDGYVRYHEDHKVYVDGFDSEDAARSHLEDLVNCRMQHGNLYHRRYPRRVQPVSAGNLS